jgi:hypothetical protein
VRSGERSALVSTPVTSATLLGPMELPAGAVYGYEIYVRPDCRKLGVSVAMIRERRILLLDASYHIGYSMLMPENTPAVAFQHAVKRIRIGTMGVA